MKTGKIIQNVLSVAVVLGVGGLAWGQEVRKGRMLERAEGKTPGVEETRLMLEVAQAPMDKVVGMLEVMGGTRIEIVDGGAIKATYKMEKGTMLRGLVETAKSAGLTIERPERSNLPINTPGTGVTWKEGSTQGYRLKAGDDLWKLPMSDAGWGMVFVSGVNKYGSVGFLSNRPAVNETTIAMLLMTERNQQILRHSGYAQVDEAISEKGESLLLDKPIEPELNLYARGLMPFSVRIKSMPEGTKIKSLKGKVFVAVETKTEDWVIGNPVGAQKQTKQVMGMEALNFEPSDRGGNFQVSMKNQQKGGTYRPTLISQHLLEDRVMSNANGEWNKAQGYDGGAGWSTINGINIYQQFSKSFQPAGSIQVRLPAEVKAVAIEFEFKDLELP